jgi:hypothetical protein
MRCSWLRGVSVGFGLILVGSLAGPAAAASDTGTVTLFDAVGALKPQSFSKSFNVSTNSRFAPGTSCELNYQIQNGKVAWTWKTRLTTAEAKNSFRFANTRDGAWSADPSLCSGNAQTKAGSDWISLEAPGPTGIGETLQLYQDHIRVGLRSIEYWTKFFGELKYRSGVTGGIPNQHLSWLTTWIPITDYTALNVVFDARLDHADIVTKPLDGVASRNSSLAQSSYDAKQHATRYRVEPVVQWRDPRCRRRIQNDPICQYFGRQWGARFEVYDERIDMEQNVGWGSPIAVRSPDVNWVYKIGLRPLLPASIATNPYKIAGKRTVAEADILPFLRRAILDAESRAADQIMPPRLTKPNGSRETDEEYFSHFGISTMNAGYEVEGVSDIAFDIYRLTLTGSLKPGQPACMLSASPTVVSPGGVATVSWNSANAVAGAINDGIGNMSNPAKGSMATTPLNRTAVISAMVTNANGEAAHCMVHVVVGKN